MPDPTEEEILRMLRHYFKLWRRGGFISGAIKRNLDNLMFYKDWEIAGTAHQPTRHKKWLVKTQGGACLYCGSTENLTQDHVIPKSRGGKNGLHNKQLLCRNCNREKGDHLYDGRI